MVSVYFLGKKFKPILTDMIYFVSDISLTSLMFQSIASKLLNSIKKAYFPNHQSCCEKY